MHFCFIHKSLEILTKTTQGITQNLQSHIKSLHRLKITLTFVQKLFHFNTFVFLRPDTLGAILRNKFQPMYKISTLGLTWNAKFLIKPKAALYLALHCSLVKFDRF